MKEPEFNIKEKIQEQLGLLLDSPEVQEKITEFVARGLADKINRSIANAGFANTHSKSEDALDSEAIKHLHFVPCKAFRGTA